MLGTRFIVMTVAAAALCWGLGAAAQPPAAPVAKTESETQATGTPGVLAADATVGGAIADTLPVQPTLPSLSNQVTTALDEAMSVLGTHYRFGGRSPDVGFDCSGLVAFVYGSVSPAVPFGPVASLRRLGATVERSDLQPGDLVFFNTRGFKFSHVGIYLGNNKFMHAPNRRRAVSVDEIVGYYAKRFDGARRLVGGDQ